MGRPEACVLFAQTFVHPHLDEYVDEVLFAEPVVVTACEFLEQNASSASQSISLLGATSPPSFALEVFVQCEGESRFRRLCQPFLYSHSSSNVLEAEAVVTNHLVVRGSYRSLSLVIYGNTAEDLGQFNIEFDDTSLTNIVSSVEGKLEDLPLPLRSTDVRSKGFIPLNVLSPPASLFDLTVEVKQLLQLVMKFLERAKPGDAMDKVVNAIATAVSICSSRISSNAANNQKSSSQVRSEDSKEFRHAIIEARNQLLELYELPQDESENRSSQASSLSALLESDNDMANSKQLVEMFHQHFCFEIKSSKFLKRENIILWLSLAFLLCSGKEGCFHFVSSGGMGQLVQLFCHNLNYSTAVVLLFLQVIEQATRHSVGCEGFLGWWPRDDDIVPSGTSDGYNQLLKLLLQKPRHDVASLCTYLLHRLRTYEVAARYECAVISVLRGFSTVASASGACLGMLSTARSQMKYLLKSIKLGGPIEDPSPVASADRSLILGPSDESLSYKVTSRFITSSSSYLYNRDIDWHLLLLLKERGVLPLSAALLSSTIMQSEEGEARQVLMDIKLSFGAIIISMLLYRSGLIFLAHQPELAAIIIQSLRGADSTKKEECLPLRYVSILLSKGFFCGSREVGTILEMHLKVVTAIDRLLIATPHSEEFLWVLWELCALSRSDCGHQALLALGYFPEAMSALIEAIRSVKEPEAVAKGASPLDVAIFHSATEIFEIIVTDSAIFSLGSWIGHAVELHRALHSSSPGSNRKDAPTRLLEWIDAGVVYHKNGAIGLLRYAAVLASGGDAHLTSTSILVSDLMEVEHSVGDSSGFSDINFMENLGKIVSEKNFDGVALRDSSVAQLTIAFRILASTSENPCVSAVLYDEGAITVIYAVLVNCRFMLERTSNNYDYLVDDGTECNSTSDLLLERNREQNLVDLLIPLLVLLINLLQKLQEANEQHRNTKLMNCLLRLHREVSPKLAACAADLSSPYPGFALGLEAVCHLTVSALAYWPVFGWSPGLFHSLLASVQATSQLALGPKETCSLFCLLIDLFPEEGIWFWKNRMPMLSALRMLAVGTLLGPQKGREVNWYLKLEHHGKVLNQLIPQVDKIAQIIQHYAISALVVVQDMLRVFIIRLACQKLESASLLLSPILSWILDHLSYPSDIDSYKVHRYLDFLASLLEHPQAKDLLLGIGIVQMLRKVLDRCLDAIDSDGNHPLSSQNLSNYGFLMLSWTLPAFKSLSLICSSKIFPKHIGRHDLQNAENLSAGDCAWIFSYLLRFFQVLPVGKELLACLGVFKDLGSSNDGRSALLTAASKLEKGRESTESYKLLECGLANYPPLFHCLKKLWSSIDSKDDASAIAVEAIDILSSGCLAFCFDGKSGLNLKAVAAVKNLFGVSDDTNKPGGFSGNNMDFIQDLGAFLSSNNEFTESARSLLSLLQKHTDSADLVDLISKEAILLSSKDSSKMHLVRFVGTEEADDFLQLGGIVDKFLWECPETLPDKSSLPVKRKMSSLDNTGRRVRENTPADLTTSSAYTRGSGQSAAPAVSTRRDTFRLRKPNTSRPPSMHVDDYVARERNVDGTSDAIAVARVGSTSGRPPSIHVDEFMARQRERQSSAATIVGEAVTRVKNAAPSAVSEMEKGNKPKQLKTDLDDDLQGIDIVFDAEESDSDDKLPFPQPDDNLPVAPSVPDDQNSPHSVVEETESDVHESGQFSHISTPVASNADENTQSEFSSRMSVSRLEKPLNREPSITSNKRFFDQSNDLKDVISIKTSSGTNTAVASQSHAIPASIYNSTLASSSGQKRIESRSPQASYAKQSPQQANIPANIGSQGPYDQKYLLNQPPLPPMPPPPPIMPSAISQPSDTVQTQSSPFANRTVDRQSPVPASFQVSLDPSVFNNSSGSSARPPPPLPPTPPPFLSSSYNLPSLNASAPLSSSYVQTGVGSTEFSQTSTMASPDQRNSAAGSRLSYPPPPLMPPMVFSRPSSVSANIYGGTLMQHQNEHPSVVQNLPMTQSPFHSVHSIGQLQPLQPPQPPHVPQPPQHIRPPSQSSQQLDQGLSLQNPIQMQVLQMLQQPQISAANTFYQSQQQEFSQTQLRQPAEQARPHITHHLSDASSSEQRDSGLSLHEYFKSPEDIQALLSDREKLCQILEEHPKLMQMLQERLGQMQ